MSRLLSPTGALRAAVLAGVVALLAAPAAAKAPTGVPSLEDLLQKAHLAEAEEKARVEAAQRDPRKESIDAYRTKKTELKDWATVVGIVLNAKDDDVQPYRLPAAEAILKRFEAEDTEKDKSVRVVRIDIGIELTELLIRPASDDKGLLAAESIFTAWWPGAVKNVWKRDAKLADRRKAYDKIKKWLKDSRK